MRVPTPNVSAVDFVFESSKSVTSDEVNNALKEASLGSMKGIIKYGDEPLVSSDYAGTNESSIVDSDRTRSIGDNLVKVVFSIPHWPPRVVPEHQVISDPFWFGGLCQILLFPSPTRPAIGPRT